MMNPAAPGQRLKKAAKKYKELAGRKWTIYLFR
jgi:hypothetical protein